MPSTTMSQKHCFAGGKSRNSSRCLSEDWVRQTDHLSIESPVVPDTDASLREEEKPPLQDEDVVRHLFSPLNYWY